MGRQSFVVILLLLQTSAVHSKGARSDDTSPLVAVVEKLSADVVSLQAQLNVQKTEIAAQKSRIAELEGFNNRTVAFSAYITDNPNTVTASQGSVIPFRSVISSIGGTYNPSTSAFTAPKDGHYFFIVHADCGTDYRGMNVNVNGHAKFAAHNDHGDGHVTGSSLLKLRSGDVVSVSHMSSTGAVDAGFESTFSGFWVK